MFWGLILRANKRYSQTVSKSFHLSQACLDLSQTPDDKDVQVQVLLTSDSENYILCTLDRKNNLQARLDLMFSEGDDIAFSCLGGSVHLTGYLVPDEEDFGFGAEDDESDLEDETPVAENLSKKGKKEVAKPLAAEDSDESDDSDANMEENGLGSDDDDMEGGPSSDTDEELEDDAEDLEDDDDESEEEEIVQPQPKKSKPQNGVNGKAEKKQKDGKKEVVVKPLKPAKEPKPAAAGSIKTLPGGLKIEDIRVGKGPEAKPGKKVQVYYEGRLQSNNKIFDSTKSGQGFQFQLGRGEVIRGWDLGVAGMKVGSKRRITCPPSLGYGVKGSPPVIPSNSTLIFDIELRNVK